MRTKLLGACAALAWAVASGVGAAPAARAAPAEGAPPAVPPAASASADSPEVTARKVALIQRYFKVIHFQRVMDSLMNGVLPAQIEAQSKDDPNMTPEARQLVLQVVKDSLVDVMPKMMDRIANLYASLMTEEELTKMVEFYESPVGQSITTKVEQASAQTGPLIRQMMPEMRDAIMKRMCAKLGCTKAKPKELGKSPA